MSREVKAGVALAVLLVVAGVALAVIAGGNGDSEASDPPRMVLERSVSPTGLGEVLVTVTGDAEPAGGAGTVRLRCLDDRDRPITDAQYPWPLEKDEEEPQPHVHQAAAPSELQRIKRCRMTTVPALTAELPLR